MKTRQGFVAAFMTVFLFAVPVMADDDKKNDLPCEKAYLNLGYYWAELDSGVKLSSQEIGIGVTVDVEDALGLDTTDQAFRIAGGWRFTKSKRHKVEIDWFQFKREGSVDIANGEEIELPDGAKAGPPPSARAGSKGFSISTSSRPSTNIPFFWTTGSI